MKYLSFLFTLMLTLVSTVSCAQGKAGEGTETNVVNSMKAEKKVLVAYFSRTGENYSVGHITKGNTHIVAEMIAARTNGTLFEIAPVKDYPTDYKECVEVAQQEQNEGARPALKDDIAVEDYEVIFLGYPNWWGDMPMPVYTFIGQHRWAGKVVIPFCTHEGSGLSDTEAYVAKACEGATVERGLAIRGATAQHRLQEAQQAVDQWLKQLGFADNAQ